MRMRSSPTVLSLVWPTNLNFFTRFNHPFANCQVSRTLKPDLLVTGMGAFSSKSARNQNSSSSDGDLAIAIP